ncbi:MAG TPA: DUF559 domain-containing protein [Dongiaceae bacterium]|nr:DUF559 domain-containing protein [Dongiaceae bacterium]
MPDERAWHLRKNMTDAEHALWRYLRRRLLDGHGFRRRVPIGGGGDTRNAVANTPREECARRLGASRSKRMAASWSAQRPTEYKVAVRLSRPTASSPRIEI